MSIATASATSPSQSTESICKYTSTASASFVRKHNDAQSLTRAPRFMPCHTVADSLTLFNSTFQCTIRSPATLGGAHGLTIDHVAGRSRTAPRAAVSPTATTGSASGACVSSHATSPTSSRPAKLLPRAHPHWWRLRVAWSLCSGLFGTSSVVMRLHRMWMSTALDDGKPFRITAPFAQ